jgi:anti-sigma regulatory factor (Ser/Thr protein kinase)
VSVRPLTPAGDGQVWLRLPARPDAVTVVRQALAGLGDALGTDDATVADISVAVSEACANVVVHAYPVQGSLEVEAWPSGRRLVVVVRDRGRGIAPRARGTSPGLGLGMPLMAALASQVCFTSPRPGTNEVWMTFRLDSIPTAQAAAPP